MLTPPPDTSQPPPWETSQAGPAATHPRARGRNFGLDAVRALAIGLVLAAHYYKHWLSTGVYGVELFFVLSGYLIGGILHREFTRSSTVPWSSLWLFWRRRWYRTLPLYYLFLLLSFVTAWRSSHHPGGAFWSLLKYSAFLQSLAWPIDGFSAVTWSLAIEEWFYFLFPLCVFYLNHAGTRVLKAFATAIAVFMIVPLALRLALPNPDWNHTTRMEVVFRLDALMFGVGLAVLKPRSGWLWRRSGACACLGAGLLLAGLGLVPEEGAAPGALGPALLFSLVPLGASLLLPAAEKLACPPRVVARPVQKISEWSYALYLAHIPVLFLFLGLFHDATLQTGGKILARAGALAATLGLAGTLHRYFERPITRRRPGG